MSKWSRRVGVSLAGAGVIVGLGMTAGIAGPPLSSAGAGSRSADASGAGIPGTLTLSESHANRPVDGPSTASWSAATVNGTNVIGTDQAHKWTGSAAALGAVIDLANSATCPGDTPLSGGTGLVACVQVLSGGAYSDPSQAASSGGIAYGAIGLSQGGGTYYYGETYVLPSSAESNGRCDAYGGSNSRASLLDLNTQTGASSTYLHNGIGEQIGQDPAYC